MALERIYGASELRRRHISRAIMRFIGLKQGRRSPMRARFRILVALLSIVATVSAMPYEARGETIESRFADVNGLRMHYLLAGKGGSPVILLHGYTQNSHMWRPLM